MNKALCTSTLVLAILLQPILVFAGSSQKNDWNNVHSIAVGTAVIIDTTTKQTIHGSIENVTDGSVTVRAAGQSQTVERSDVHKLYVAGRGSKGKSIAIGAAVGAGAGLGIGAAVQGSSRGSDEPGLLLAAGLVVGAAVGSAIGAALGGHSRHLVYESK